ncbi:hypothetical protein A8H35_25795 [Burkholderia thailandensis]|uniref:Uncharacterized protein n=1 Tax=Burkholderia thailandensis (strain ATCC 700388 / DSM 13276 / CCUG 48851 / CIP 106301 / E264) TaxID=271848 RepID=Q2T8J0_BURTA|nr:hypothetical protein BTH_II0308 [Burkholderia thailandensis E264]AVR07042.1 hypothetical protein A8H31_05680 [Burkholderia thailandensis]AWY61565.1 hypothetical protein A8H35_25795 [Burkholderia thailandensis]AWY65646.1 hypothetical protein A8H36_10960 [Burkholderia thailandensis]NOK44794.1 hypothetical protein [Burkholderia thailandensis]
MGARAAHATPPRRHGGRCRMVSKPTRTIERSRNDAAHSSIHRFRIEKKTISMNVDRIIV